MPSFRKQRRPGCSEMGHCPGFWRVLCTEISSCQNTRFGYPQEGKSVLAPKKKLGHFPENSPMGRGRGWRKIFSRNFRQQGHRHTSLSLNLTRMVRLIFEGLPLDIHRHRRFHVWMKLRGEWEGTGYSASVRVDSDNFKLVASTLTWEIIFNQKRSIHWCCDGP